MKSPFSSPCLALESNFHPELDCWLETRVGFEFFQEDRANSRAILKTLTKRVQSTTSPFIVTVAGTNGKGETCLYLEQLFRHQKISVGLFTSPHILSPTERFRFNGRPVKAPFLLQNFEKNAHLAKSLSYYEFLFYCFLDIALKKKPQVLIFEVGLGGKRDAVNLIDANITALASISHDHTEILGPRLKDILMEKLGITRTGVPLISALKRPHLISLTRSFCQTHNIPLCQLSINRKFDFKQRNAILAKEIFKISCQKLQLKMDPSPISLNKTSFGRGQIVTSSCGRFMLLGSHNTDGLRQAMHWLATLALSPEKEYSFSGVISGLSRKDSKDLAKCLKIILGSPYLAKDYYFCAFNHLKATPAQLLEKAVKQMGKTISESQNVSFCKNISLAFQKMGNNPSKNYLVTGSYYFLGEFLKNLHSHCGYSIAPSQSKFWAGEI